MEEYNIITNPNGTLTYEDGSTRYATVEGSTVQFFHLENGGNPSPRYVTYTTSPNKSDQTVYSSQTFSLNRQIQAAQIESGSSVYIIKQNESSTPQSLEIQLLNQSLINNPEIKTVSLNINSEGQQMQWMSTQDDSTNVNVISKENVVTPVQVVPTVRNQQNNIALNTPGQYQRQEVLIQNSNDKREVKFVKTTPRHCNLIPTRLVNKSGLNNVVNFGRVQNPTTKCFSADVAIQPMNEPKIANTSVSDVTSSQISYPEMEHLSERIRSVNKLKEQTAQQTRPQLSLSSQIKAANVATKSHITGHLINRPVVAPRGVAVPGTTLLASTAQLTTRQLTAVTSPTGLQRAPVPRQVVRPATRTPLRTLPRQITPTSPQPRVTLSQIQQRPSLSTKAYVAPQTAVRPSPARVMAATSLKRPPPPEPMETDIQEEEFDQSVSSIEPDTASNCTIFREEIKNPQSTIVQRQIEGNLAKMLLVLPTREQRLITFDIPKEDCTVHDLLEQAGIPWNPNTTVSLVSDASKMKINYVVNVNGNAQSEVSSNASDSEMSTESYNPVIESSSQNVNMCDENSNSSTQTEITRLPKFIPGKLAVCAHCGMNSADFTFCQRCRRQLPDNVKTIPDNACRKTISLDMKSEIPVSTFYKKSPDSNQKFELVEKDAKRCLKRGRPKKQAQKEPECLIISSDEEESAKKDISNTRGCTSVNNADKMSTSYGSRILEKEPLITNNTDETLLNKSQNLIGTHKFPKDQPLLIQPGNLQTTLECRTIRIGSYKYMPIENVIITSSSLKLKVPLLEDENTRVPLEIPMEDIVKVLVHFGKSMPVLFYYTTVQFGVKVRELLGMQDPKEFYYDPAGKDQSHKRISLLPETLTDESKQVIKAVYLKKMDELNSKEANEILFRASPKDTTTPKKVTQPTLPNPNERIQTIAVYPQKQGISINTDDYMCLGEDQFLNDVIIDFYLKYLSLEILSSSDRNRTHIFSSYFYKRLTSPHTQANESLTLLSAAAKRHARVSKWTKNVNIFKKDFIVIPINEHAHWFLAIICFPGLVGKVATSPIIKKEKTNKSTSSKGKEVKIALKIGNTTITPLSTCTNTTITLDRDDDGSERDEAEGDDEEMETDTTDEETEIKPENDVQKSEPTSSQPNIINKMPCILIFDSLAGASRSRVVATLRDYLQCEHLAKMGVERIFSKDTIKGSNVKVPQQSNFTDCGLYVLQYVESFFKDPITDYRLPIKTLKNWFEEIVVTRKREEISKLLIKLMNAWKGNREIILPTVIFPTQDGKLKKLDNSETKATKQENESKKKTPEVEKNEAINAIIQTSNKVSMHELVAYSSSSSSSPDESQTEHLVSMRCK